MKNSKILNAKQLSMLFKNIEGFNHCERDRLVIALTYYCAMRIGEVAQLKWSDVVDNNLIPQSQITFKKEQVKGKEPQRVLVSKRCRAEINRYLKFYIAKKGKIDFNKHLIMTQRNSPFTANSLCIHINAVYRKANLPHVTSHSGRKSYITSLANKAVNVKVIMKLARHKNLSTTQKYIEVNDEQLEEANELV